MFLPNWLRPRRPVTIRHFPKRTSRFVQLHLETLEDRITPTGPIILQAGDASQLQTAVKTADNNPGQQYLIQLTASFQLTSNLVLSNPSGVTLDGAGNTLTAAANSGLFSVIRGGNATFMNVTLTGGNAVHTLSPLTYLGGGAIEDSGSNVTLNGVKVIGNTITGSAGALDADGGGVFVSNGSLTVLNSSFAENKAVGGNGLTGRNGTSDSANGGNGTNGGSGQGGGIYSTNSTISISNSSFSNNIAQGGNGGNGGFAYTKHNGANGGSGGSGGDGNGGGIYANGSSLVLSIVNTAVSSNFAVGGTGGNGRDGTPKNAITAGYRSGPGGNGGNGGNGGTGAGGGIYVLSDSTASLTNNSITGNHADGGGDGGGGGGAAGGFSQGLDGNGGNGGNGGSGGSATGGGLYASGEISLINNTVANNEVSAVGGAGGAGGGGGGGGSPGGQGGTGGIGGHAEGGGVYDNSSGQSTYINNTVANNSASGGSGTPGTPGGQPNGIAGTAGTSASAFGGGFYVFQSEIAPNKPAFFNNLLQGNGVSVSDSTVASGGPDYYGPVNSAATNNFVSNASNASGVSTFNPATNTLNNIANQLGSLTTAPNGTSYYPLLPLVKSVNGGTNSVLPAIAAAQGLPQDKIIDQIGNPRVVNQIIDIGAIEFQGIPTTTTVASVSTMCAATDQTVTLTATVKFDDGAPVTEGEVTFTVVDANGKQVGNPITPQPVAVNTLGQASAQYKIPAGTHVGDYTIEANYTDYQQESDTGNNAPSTGKGTLTINQCPTQTSVANLDTHCAASDQTITLNATVTYDDNTPVMDGEVAFSVVDASGKQVGNAITLQPVAVNNLGQASAQYKIPAGTPVSSPTVIYTIKATYTDNLLPGDSGNFIGSSGKGTLTLNQCPPPTISDITVSPSTVFACNHPVIASATFTSPDDPVVNEGAVVFTLIGPNGSPSIASNPVPVENGVASTANMPNNANLIVPFAAPSGSYNLLVSYTDTNPPYPGNFESETTTVDNAVTVQTPSTNVSVSDLTIDYSPSPQTFTLTAGVTSKDCPPVTEGAVTFTVTTQSGTIVVPTTEPVPVSNNQASTSVTVPGALPPGNPGAQPPTNYIIQASYTDSLKGYSSSTGTGTLTVTPPFGSVANVSVPYRSIDPDTNLNNQITLTATVADRAGIPINDGQVVFKVFDSSGNQVGNTTFSTGVQNGQAQTLFTLPQGTPLGNYSVTASYNIPNSTISVPVGTGTLTIATAPTTVYITNVGITFGFSEQDTITAYVVSNPQYSLANPSLQGGFLVNEGSVTFTDNGQTMVVPVQNSVATATFNIPVFAENPLTHSISATYNSSTSKYSTNSSTHMFTAAQEIQILMEYLLQMMFLQFIINNMPGHS